MSIPLKILRNVLASGLAATATMALLEGKGTAQPLNATSDMIHGDEAAAFRQADVDHTVIGFGTRAAATISWATAFETALYFRPARNPVSIAGCASGIGLLAALVGYDDAGVDVDWRTVMSVDPEYAARHIDTTERPNVPALSIIFGYGPMMPFVAGALASWLLGGLWRAEAVLLAVLWAGAILAFLAGVRRGLSFRTEGGPALAQIATMVCLFVLALGALMAVCHGLAISAVVILLAGFSALMVLDPIAARAGQAPLFFARLRPPQMAIAVVSLGALLANLLMR